MPRNRSREPAARSHRFRVEGKHGQPHPTNPPQESSVITATRASTKSIGSRRCGRVLNPFCDLEKQCGRLRRQFYDQGQQLRKRVSRDCAGFCAGCRPILRLAARIRWLLDSPWGYCNGRVIRKREWRGRSRFQRRRPPLIPSWSFFRDRVAHSVPLAEGSRHPRDRAVGIMPSRSARCVPSRCDCPERNGGTPAGTTAYTPWVTDVSRLVRP